MPEQKPVAMPSVTIGPNKRIKGYMVTHPKGYTYFLNSLSAIKYTYGVDEEQLKNMGWDIQALEE